MTDNDIIKANDILEKFDFFGGQRAGRELWNDKPIDVQNKDIENFSKDVAFLKDFINRQKAEIERLESAFKQVTWERDALLKWSVPEIYPYCVIGIVGVDGAIFTKSHEEYDKLIANIKAEAIKEFAERLKKESIEICSRYDWAVEECTIDRILKEMVCDV